MSESIVAVLRLRIAPYNAISPARKRERLAYRTGNVRNACTRAKESAYFRGCKNPGIGRCTMCPMDRYIRGTSKQREVRTRLLSVTKSGCTGWVAASGAVVECVSKSVALNPACETASMMV